MKARKTTKKQELPCGEKYLRAKERFDRKHKSDAKLRDEVDDLLHLSATWFATVTAKLVFPDKRTRKIMEKASALNAQKAPH